MENLALHNRYMARCLQLAALGGGFAPPNPLVGSVLVAKGRIIGEGWHKQCGGKHAEVEAINSVKPEDKQLIKNCTVYVNLEPCAHIGRTGSCASLLVEKQVGQVFIGTVDPDKRVASQGIQRLKEAGIAVQTGILEAECMELNRFYMTSRIRNRPWVGLKWAQTENGIVGQSVGEPIKISNPLSQRIAHKWRSEFMSILIGAGTVMSDNPKLNVRFGPGPDPLKIIIGRKEGLEQDAAVFQGQENKDYILFDITSVKEVQKLLDLLAQQQINSVLVEGGPATHKLFLESGLWDELLVFEASNNEAISKISNPVFAPNTKGQLIKTITIGNNLFHQYRNPAFTDWPTIN